MRRLRVCLVEFSPSGGLFQFALQLGEGIAELGHDVELVTGGDPELQPRAGGLRLVPILPTWHPGAGVEPSLRRKVRRVVRGARYLEAWRRVVRHVHQSRPDVVQFGEWRFSVDGWMAAWLARRPWAPVLVDLAHSPLPLEEQHADGALYKTGPLLRRGLGSGYRHLDAVMVLGERSRHQMIEAWPGVARVEVIPHGGEEIFLGSEAVPPAEATPPRVLFFGIWARYKGLDLLLDAFSLVRARLPDAELVVAGSVESDVDVDALARRAAEIGGIDLRPGYVPVEDVPGLVGGCRVVAAPYRAANQSGVVHLAQTLSRPVVVTDVGDLASAVTDGETGLLVPPEDPSAFAAAVERLLRDPAEAGRLGRNGQRRVRSEASWREVAGRVVAIYEDLVSINPERGGRARRRRSPPARR